MSTLNATTVMEPTWLSTLKGALIGIVSSILAYLTPIYDIMLCIGISFAGNFLWGYIAGMVVQKESFCLKKAKVAFYEALVYASLVVCIFTIGEKMDNRELALKALSIITWAWIYFYLVNIFKNLTRLFPRGRGMAFVYFVISLEFVKHFPYLKEFLEKEQTNEEVSN